MTITPQVKRQFFAHDGERSHVIRLPPAAVASPVGPNRRIGKPWTKDEHERFLEGLQIYPNGPWRRIATHVGTRTSRQTMTHAQKYRERISRMLVPPHEMKTLSSSPPRKTSTSSSTPPLSPPPPAPLPVAVRATVVNQHRFDALDLEILSCLLDDGEPVSDDSSSTCSENSDDFLGDLLSDIGEDESMLDLFSEFDMDDQRIMVAP